MKRVLDLALSAFLLVLFFPLFLLVSLLVKLTSQGPIIYWSERVGLNNKIFTMPKFRTMKIGTPQVATHLLQNNTSHLTSIGSFLRKTSLDELPQLYSILVNDMSFVGPRPALFNQHDLISKRTSVSVHMIKPGVTGWAQINGRDEISIEQKVELDLAYLQKRSTLFDLKIISLTLVKVILRIDIAH